MWGTRRRRLVLLALGLTLAVAAACGGLGLFASQAPRAEAAALAQAEVRWAARPFGAYHLTLQERGCLQEIEIRGERVVRTEANRCQLPRRAVTDLFTLIRRDGTVSYRCIALGCACDDVITVDATYHQTLGYPEQITVRVAARPNWQHPDFWSYLVRNQAVPDCGLAEGGKVMRVLALTPIE